MLAQLQQYVASPERNPREELGAQARRREEMVADARRRLAERPEDLTRFELSLRDAREGTIISEDHNYWIDYSSTYRVREVLMECGSRLAAAGVLGARADVRFLRWAEVRQALLSLPDGDQRALIVKRKREMEHWRGVTPPSSLGTFKESPEEVSGGGSTLRGNPGSPGTARGPARILRTVADAERLRDGDVLVSATSAPPWTAFFGIVAGVVTDAGDLLSHTAVVAREYGVPAVVGAVGATSLIEEGDTLEIDGSRGEVVVVNR